MWFSFIKCRVASQYHIACLYNKLGVATTTIIPPPPPISSDVVPRGM